MAWPATLSILLCVVIVMQIVMLWRMEKARRETLAGLLVNAQQNLALAQMLALQSQAGRIHTFTVSTEDQPGVMH